MREYPVIESLPYCCVAASLESILKSHGIHHVAQTDMANYVGLVIPESLRGSLPEGLTNIRFSEESSQQGMQLKNDTFDNLFSHFGLPFKETYLNWDTLSDINFESILSNLKETQDAILYFDFGVLYNENQNVGTGHAGVFESLGNDTISYMNPGPRFLGINSFKSDDFLHAIRSRRGGISIIDRI